MKRYGKKSLIAGMRIRYDHVNRVYNTSPTIINTKYGDNIGYITYDLFMTMLKNSTIIKDFGDYYYSEYIVK